MLARVRGYGADGFSSRFGPGRAGDRRGHALTARDMRQRVSMDRNRKHGWCKRCTRQPIIKSRSMAATAGAGAIPAVDNDRLKTGSRTPAMQCRRAVSPGSDDQVRQRSTDGVPRRALRPRLRPHCDHRIPAKRWRSQARPFREIENSVGSNGETLFRLKRERAFDRRYRLL